MKKLLAILLLYTTTLSAQTLSPFEDSKTAVDFISTLELYHNSYYYLYEQVTNDSVVISYANEATIYIKKINKNNQTILSQPVVFNADTLNYITLDLVQYKDTFYNIIMQTNSPKPDLFNNINRQHNLFLLKFDSTLQYQQLLKLNITNVINVFPNFKIVDDSTLLVAAYVNDFSSNICNVYSINKNTGIVNNFSVVHPLTTNRYFATLGDTLFHLFTGGELVNTFNKNANLVNSSNVVALPNYESSFGNYGAVYWQNKPLRFFLLDTNLINAPITKWGLFTFDYQNSSYMPFYVENVPPLTNSDNGIISVDVLDTSYVFSCNGFYRCPTFSSNTVNCVNPLIINKIDATGNLLWSKTFGNDASHLILSIKATPDSGCMVFTTRFKNNFNKNEYDIYYVKLDKNGNQEFNYLPTNVKELTINIEDRLSIYPNPASNYVAIKNENLLNKNYNYFITTIDGKIVKKGILTNQKIEINEMKNGVYIFTLVVANEQKSISTQFIKQ